MEHTLIHVSNPDAFATFDDEQLGDRDFVAITEGSKLRIDLDKLPATNIRQNYRQLREFVEKGLANVDLSKNTVTVVRDFPEVSPSAASVMATGRQGSGWKLWRLEDGQLLETLREDTNMRQRTALTQQACGSNPTFPDIRYDYPELPALNRQSFTVGGMKTLMGNRGFGKYTNEISQNPTGEEMRQFEYLIKGEVRQLLKNGDKAEDESYISIFHKIQLWGGIAGRNIYRNDGFNENFSILAYKAIVNGINRIKSIESFNDNISDIITECGNIQNWGPAFATKHFKFISSAAGCFSHPIYDSVIAKGLYHKKVAQWNNYRRYVQEIHAFAAQQNSSAEIVERVLFNHFGAR